MAPRPRRPPADRALRVDTKRAESLNTASKSSEIGFVATTFELLRHDRRQLASFAFSLAAGDYRHRVNPPRLGDWNGGDARLRIALRNCLLSRLDTPRQRAWKGELILGRIDRSSERVSHQSSTDRLMSLGSSISATNGERREAFFAASRACASAALFRASQIFLELAYERVELDAEKTRGFRDTLSAVLVSIQRGHAAEATERWHSLSDRVVPDGLTRDAWAITNRYLALWLRIDEAPLATSTLDAVDSGWKELVAERSVLLIGPAPRLQPSDADKHDLTARIFRGTALTEALASPGREIMYLNDDPQLPAEPLAVVLRSLHQLRHIASKNRVSRLALPNHHHTDLRVRRLFPTGHPNMVPVAALDILAGGARSIYVEGADFYSSQAVYAAPLENRVRLHLCNSIARHNPNENRRLVTNLVNVGLISGDQQFLTASGLDDDLYFLRLDQNLGEWQI